MLTQTVSKKTFFVLLSHQSEKFFQGYEHCFKKTYHCTSHVSVLKPVHSRKQEISTKIFCPISFSSGNLCFVILKGQLHIPHELFYPHELFLSFLLQNAFSELHGKHDVSKILIFFAKFSFLRIQLKLV